MPRYLIERTFPDDNLALPGLTWEGQTRLTLIENNTLETVTWIHSYLALDRKKSFCLYDAPGPEAIRRAAQRNGLPVDRITEVRVLDPYGRI